MGRRHEFPAQRKALSQVFLRAEWPVHKVVDKLKSWQVSRVLEVGPGGGMLTKALVSAGLKVTAVEKDGRFAEQLVDHFRGDTTATGRIEIVERDVLRFDLSEWLAISREPTAIVGNIPYNISSPILMWALPHLARLKGICFMVQLEFAQRLAANPDTKAYGSLSVFTQLRAKVELDCKVDRNCFTPVPKVDSALVSFRGKTNPLPDKLLSKVELVTRSSFNQRRKILKNAIKPYLGEDRERTSPIDLSRRPETLWPEEFVTLAQHLFPKDD